MEQSATDSSMEKYFTKDRAEEGIKVPLSDISGKETGDWIKIIGTDSDVFTLANAAALRRAVEINKMEDLAARDKETIRMSRELVAHLVIDWSFNVECSRENVLDFLQRAPQIQRQIDLAANSRALFWKVGSGSSASTQRRSSGSTKRRKGAGKPSAKV